MQDRSQMFGFLSCIQIAVFQWCLVPTTLRKSELTLTPVKFVSSTSAILTFRPALAQ